MGCTHSVRQNIANEDLVAQNLADEPEGSQYCRRAGASVTGGPRKLFTDKEDLKDKLVGVVVTIFEGSSYDEMFREVRPTTVPGERVSTYSISNSEVEEMHLHLASNSHMPVAWQSLVEDVRAVEADAVVFNFECCSECGDNAFPCGQRRGRTNVDGAATGSPTIAFIGFAMKHGFTVMCSDFSLKSLIFEWSEAHLGPNPFVKLGECDGGMNLEFDPRDLKDDEVPQQLQVVGELCSERGKAVVACMPGTIVYTVNPERKRTNVYDIKVLTVVTEHESASMQSVSESMKCKVGSGNSEKAGTAGHIALTYTAGGQLIASNGHWIELTKIDTTAEDVIRVAARNFGSSKVNEFQDELQVLSSVQERFECTQKHAKQLVQESVATRMKCRSKF